MRQLGRRRSDIVTVYLSKWSDQPYGPKNDGQVDVAQKRFMRSYNKVFVNEVKIMADLKHHNVVSLLHYVADRRSCSIVMELMDGDLNQFMLQKRLDNKVTPTSPFSIDDATNIILQIAQGMEYVHGKNIVHRDLKSCNILVKISSKGRQLEIKVADFGLSKKLASRDTLLEEDLDVGTIRWMSPEVMNGSSKPYDPFKSDIYSFGMVCYEILVGRVHFYEINKLDEVKKKVLGGERPILQEWIPLHLKIFIEGCWLEKESERPSFADIFRKLSQG